MPGSKPGKKQNPPIPGHEMLHEGHMPYGLNYGCRCGAKPENAAVLSINQMKAWHRGHKAELRGEPTGPVPVGVFYCIAHEGVANEDDYRCDFAKHDDAETEDEEPRPCDFRQCLVDRRPEAKVDR
jgi:hypothetical protein